MFIQGCMSKSIMLSKVGCQCVGFSHQVAKVLQFQLQHESFQSLEKTLMLGKIEGKSRGRQQRKR